MDKILKLSFPTKEDWETTKATLIGEDKNWKPGIIDAFELGRMQKPPEPDWQPDPNNPEDNGWGFYPDFAVDLVVDGDYDFDDLQGFLIAEPKSGKFGHTILDGDYEIVYKRS